MCHRASILQIVVGVASLTLPDVWDSHHLATLDGTFKHTMEGGKTDTAISLFFFFAVVLDLCSVVLTPHLLCSLYYMLTTYFTHRRRHAWTRQIQHDGCQS